MKDKVHLHHHTKVSPSTNPLPTYFQKSPNQYNFNNKYLNLAKTFTVGAIGASLILYVVDQRERVDELERQLSVQRKNQKDLVSQIQNYKRKVNNLNIENSKRDVIIQGRLQTHIALLRQQLINAGLSPVDVLEAKKQFKDEVKMSISSQSIDLWVPSSSGLKPVFPDLMEYKNDSK